MFTSPCESGARENKREYGHGPVSAAIECGPARARCRAAWGCCCVRRRCRTSISGRGCASFSRDYLTPWEPIWPSDDLTRVPVSVAGCGATPKTSPPIKSYPFLDVSGKPTATMIGGVTLANVRRGIVQAGTIGYWTGATPCGHRGYMTAGTAGAAAHACSASSTCTASRPPAFPSPIRSSIRVLGEMRIYP